MSYESHKYYNGNLYANIIKDVKNQQLFKDLHVGITMDVKKRTTMTRPICEYYNGCKTQTLLQNLYAGILMVGKKPTSITRPICEYYIFEMALWKL
jgi:hypothetical protein